MTALKVLLVVLLLFLTGCASAPDTVEAAPSAEAPKAAVPAVAIPVHVWSDGATTIKLMPGPCTDPVVKPFLESVGELEKFKAIESVWLYRDGQGGQKMKAHGGCWAEFSAKDAGAPEAIFVLFFDDGDKAVIPKAEFLRGKGTGT